MTGHPMKFFNTSGPNIPARHYTLGRPRLVEKGVHLVQDERYFTIWAPRQTGKSTYFRLLKDAVERLGMIVMHLNVENYQGATLRSFLTKFKIELQKTGISTPDFETFDEVSTFIEHVNDRKLVLIIDEAEGLNPDLFGQFLHTIRNLYHSRETHCLKSVVLVGVSNIVGVVSDNASPFNIADNLNVPYFTPEEVRELLGQHTAATGQVFLPEVADKIFGITAGQPGLVNGFAGQLVERNPDAPQIDMDAYFKVEDWYTTEAIDKNIENILNKSKQHRAFLESLLFADNDIPFVIDRPAIKFLHANGVIRRGAGGMTEFWVPLYKKRLFQAFYPYTNGEQGEIRATMDSPAFFDAGGGLDIPKLMGHYKAYAAKRGFKVFLEKNRKNKKVLKESGLIYSFETFLAAFVAEAGGRMYREADAGLGKSDLIVYLNGREYLFETKKYYSPAKFRDGKKQLVHYARSLGLAAATYMVFVPNHLTYPAAVTESKETDEGNALSVFLVSYDEVKDF
jgi:AAA-like domain